MGILRKFCDTSLIFQTCYYIQAMLTFPEASQWCIRSGVITDDLGSKRSTFYRDEAWFISKLSVDGSNTEVQVIVE